MFEPLAGVWSPPPRSPRSFYQARYVHMRCIHQFVERYSRMYSKCSPGIKRLCGAPAGTPDSEPSRGCAALHHPTKLWTTVGIVIMHIVRALKISMHFRHYAEREMRHNVTNVTSSRKRDKPTTGRAQRRHRASFTVPREGPPC
jgi:hypothetical protein